MYPSNTALHLKSTKCNMPKLLNQKSSKLYINTHPCKTTSGLRGSIWVPWFQWLHSEIAKVVPDQLIQQTIKTVWLCIFLGSRKLAHSLSNS